MSAVLRVEEVREVFVGEPLDVLAHVSHGHILKDARNKPYEVILHILQRVLGISP